MTQHTGQDEENYPPLRNFDQKFDVIYKVPGGLYTKVSQELLQ